MSLHNSSSLNRRNPRNHLIHICDQTLNYIENTPKTLKPSTHTPESDNNKKNKEKLWVHFSIKVMMWALLCYTLPAPFHKINPNPPGI